MSHLLLDAADRFVSEIAQDAVRGNMVVAVVCRIGHFDFHVQVGELGLDDLGDVDDFVVLETEVEGAAIDFLRGSCDQQPVEVDHIGHADIRAALLSSMNGDDLFAQRISGELVHREIEPLARRVTTNRGGAHIDSTKLGTGGGKNEPFGEGFVFRIVGQRLGFEAFVDFRLGPCTEDTGRGGIDETFHAGLFSQGEQHADGVEIHLPREDFIDVASRIVGDCRQMDDSVPPSKGFAHFGRVAQVAANETNALFILEPFRVGLEGLEPRLRVEHKIEDADIVSEPQKMRDKPAANVAESACDEDF